MLVFEQLKRNINLSIFLVLAAWKSLLLGFVVFVQSESVNVEEKVVTLLAIELLLL